MAKITKKKAKTSRTKRTSVKRKVKEPSLAEIESSVEKSALMDFAQNTKEELSKLGEKIHEASDRGVHLAKEIAENVRHFAVNATNLTKIKIDLHNLRSERENSYSIIGKKLLKLHNTNKLANVRVKFKKDFEKLALIESAIAEKEKQVTDSSFLTAAKK